MQTKSYDNKESIVPRSSSALEIPSDSLGRNVVVCSSLEARYPEAQVKQC